MFIPFPRSVLHDRSTLSIDTTGRQTDLRSATPSVPKAGIKNALASLLVKTQNSFVTPLTHP